MATVSGGKVWKPKKEEPPFIGPQPFIPGWSRPAYVPPPEPRFFDKKNQKKFWLFSAIAAVPFAGLIWMALKNFQSYIALKGDYEKLINQGSLPAENSYELLNQSFLTMMAVLPILGAIVAVVWLLYVIFEEDIDDPDGFVKANLVWSIMTVITLAPILFFGFSALSQSTNMGFQLIADRHGYQSVKSMNDGTADIVDANGKERTVMSSTVGGEYYLYDTPADLGKVLLEESK